MGDDRSISGSSDTSDTSQSDFSISSRPAQWTDLLLPGSVETQTEASQVEVKLSAGPADPIRSRKLKETGRQNSSDSGIATGSHSSYTGSFSSYSGSLDVAGPVDEYGILLNLQPPAVPDKHLCTCDHEYQVPTSLRYFYDTPRSLLDISRDSRAYDDAGLTETFTQKQCKANSESADQSHSGLVLEIDEGEESSKGEEHQGFSCSKSCSDCAICSLPSAGSKSLFNSCPICGGLKGSFPAHPGGPSLPIVSAPPTADVTGSPINHDPLEISETNQNPRKTSSECSPTNEEKRCEAYVSCLSDLLSHYSLAGKSDARSVYEAMSSSRRSVHSRHTVLYENCVQCRAGEGSCRLLRSAPPSRDASVQEHSREPRRHIPESPSSPSEHLSWPISLQRIPEEDNREKTWTEKGRTDPAYETMDGRTTDRSSESDERSRCDVFTSRVSHHHLTEGGVFLFPPDGLRDAVTYVNIPISPTSKKQLNYMELELQETSAGVRGSGSSKYAQIDVTAMEAAHRAGTQHALGREEGLQRLEQQKRRRRRHELRDTSSEE